MIKKLATMMLVAVAGTALAGQPVDRFFGAETFTFTFGDNAPRYGKTDSNIRIEIDAFLLGTQVIETTGGSDEFVVTKDRGSLNFKLKLSDLNVLFPPDTVTLNGSVVSGDDTLHITDQVLAGPYTLVGEIEGVQYNLTLRNVRVRANIESRFSNNVTAPAINPLLNLFCDVQFDERNGGANNTITVRPGQVSGWIVSPVFFVTRVAVDVADIQQTGQVPERSVVPDAFTIRLGRLESGNVGSLARVDGDSLRVCRFIVPNQSVAPVTVEVRGKDVNDLPLAFVNLQYTSRMSVNGLFTITADLFDWSTNGFSPVDVRTDNVNTSFSTRVLAGTGDVSRYVNPGDGTVTARYRVRQTGPAANPAWCHEVDEFRWIVTP